MSSDQPDLKQEIPPHPNEFTQEWVETGAYYQWINEGCPEGRHLEHWDQVYRLFQEIHKELKI